MTEELACPECGTGMSTDAPRGLCPRSLMGAPFSAMETCKAAEKPQGAAPTPGESAVDIADFQRAALELELEDALEPEWFVAVLPGDVALLAQELLPAGKLTPRTRRAS